MSYPLGMASSRRGTHAVAVSKNYVGGLCRTATARAWERGNELTHLQCYTITYLVIKQGLITAVYAYDYFDGLFDAYLSRNT